MQAFRHSQSFCVEKRVAIAIWRLGTNIEYRSLSNLTGVGTSTACVIVHEVREPIVHTFRKKYINIPVGNEAMDIVREVSRRDGVFRSVLVRFMELIYASYPLRITHGCAWAG